MSETSGPRTNLPDVFVQVRGWSWRGDSNPDPLFTRQARIVQGVLARAVLAAQLGGVVQLVRSCRTEWRQMGMTAGIIATWGVS
jgi:hypothetical protein